MRLSTTSLAAVLALTLSGPASTQQPDSTAFAEEFDGAWDARWEAQRLAARANRHGVDLDDGVDPVLRLDSRRAASALVRRVVFDAPRRGFLSWRWKVMGTVGAGRDPRKKSGDDFAARVFVVFDDDFGSGGARAVCYVWSADQPLGATFPSPYTDRVAIIVVESGDAAAGRWSRVRRNFIDDYTTFFGDTPKTITGVALMTDTDNTASATTSFFDDIRFFVAR